MTQIVFITSVELSTVNKKELDNSPFGQNKTPFYISKDKLDRLGKKLTQGVLDRTKELTESYCLRHYLRLRYY
jgi:hypothetical protein